MRPNPRETKGSDGGYRSAAEPKLVRLARLGLYAFALMTPALVQGPAHADEATSAAQSLISALESFDAGPARLRLIDGRTVIGRIVRTRDEAIMIRRPSGGLRTVPLADIVALNIKAADGSLIAGRVVKLEDGGVGWLADGARADETRIAGSDQRLEARGTETAPSETGSRPDIEIGGPLIRLDVGEQEAGASETADVDIQTAALTPAIEQDGSDLDSRSPIRLEVTADDAIESDKLLQFRLTLSEPPSQPVLIIFTMIDGSAQAPGDYTHRQGTVVFNPGETEVMVTTDIVDDEAIEGIEDVQFFVSGDPAAVTIETRKIVAKINDDDV